MGFLTCYAIICSYITHTNQFGKIFHLMHVWFYRGTSILGVQFSVIRIQLVWWSICEDIYCRIFVIRKNWREIKCVNTGTQNCTSPSCGNLCSCQNKWRVPVWAYVKDVCNTLLGEKGELQCSHASGVEKKTNKMTHTCRVLKAMLRVSNHGQRSKWASLHFLLCIFVSFA